MQFLAYFAAVVIAVAGVMFGIEVATAPVPHKPAAHVAGPTNKLSRYETARREEKTEGDRSRPLTPLYPASPGGKDVRVISLPGSQSAGARDGAPVEVSKAAQGVEPKTAPKAGAAPPQPMPLPPEQQVASAPPQQKPQENPQEKPQVAKADEQPKPATAAAPPVLQAQNHCDVAACGRAYSSFRAADCTYQPYEGPRRACTAPPPSRSTERYAVRAQASSQVSEARRNPDERRGTYSSNAVIYRDDAAMDRDDDDDSIDRVGTGRRVIILDRNGRPWN